MKRLSFLRAIIAVAFLNLSLVHLAIAEEISQRFLSFKESLQIASEHDIHLILSQERLVQALARVEQSKSLLYPHFNLTSSQRRQTRDLRSSGISFSGDPLVGPFNTFDARAELTQTLFDASTISRLKSAQAGEKLSNAELRKTKQDVLALVANMYINARRSEQSLSFAEMVLARESKRLAIIQNRIENGISTDLELKQMQAGYDAAVSFQKQMETQALNTRLDLLSALGLDLNQKIQFAYEDDFNLEVSQDESVNVDKKDLPELEVAKQEFLVSQHNRAAAKSAYFPKISAIADYGLSGIEPSDSNETYTLGLQASLPLFDGGFRRSGVKEAESQFKAKEANLRDVGIKLNSKIIQIHEAVKQSQLLVAEKLSKLDSVQKQLSLAQKQLEDGTSTEVEVLEFSAQQALAQDELNEAKAVLLISEVNWFHVLGKMEDLAKESTQLKELNP